MKQKQARRFDPDALKAFGEIGVALVDQAVARKSTTCEWGPTTDGNDHGDWSTGCGYEYTINDGTPKENGMAFCCFCGGKLLTRKAKRK